MPAVKRRSPSAHKALFTQQGNPLGLPVSEVKRTYLHDGEGEGWAALDEDIVWRPGSGTITAPTTERPHSKPEAVGMIDFTARTGAKQRAENLQAALLPAPSEVTAALRERLERYLNPDDLAGTLTMLAERGWEATEGVYVQRGRDAKQAWAGITGRAYGVKLATGLAPEGMGRRL